jgi:hypothetical protein
MPSATDPPPSLVPNGPKEEPDQYKPEMNKSPQGDFMRPSSRATNSSNAKANGVGVQVEDTRICVVMVGLPARGKSLIAQKGMHAAISTIGSLVNVMCSCSLSWLAQHKGEMFQRGLIS